MTDTIPVNTMIPKEKKGVPKKKKKRKTSNLRYRKKTNTTKQKKLGPMGGKWGTVIKQNISKKKKQVGFFVRKTGRANSSQGGCREHTKKRGTPSGNQVDACGDSKGGKR